MKIRSGFVSNSSSCSFTCCISGSTTSGRDGYYEDFTPINCCCGHGFAPQYALDIPENPTLEQKRDIIQSECLESSLKNCDDVDWDNLSDEKVEEVYAASEEDIRGFFSKSYHERGISEAPECICPVCAFQKISRNDRIKYLLKEILGDEGSFKKVDKDIKEKFGNYNDFENYIKEIKP